MDVVVVGSVNGDVSVLAERLPRPGETVIGTTHHTSPGGKGANQAVAASRLGAQVAMVACVGDDSSGTSLKDGLAGEGVDINAVEVSGELPTGAAFITIDSHADNQIVVSPGANLRVTTDQIRRHAVSIASARVVVAQLEIPVESVCAAAEATEGLFILNPAPARPLQDSLLEAVDVLILNESELAFLSGSNPATELAEIAAQAGRFPGTSVVTLGSRGALLVHEGSSVHFAAPQVEAIDPTGAGDTFCGAVAARLSRGVTIQEAVPFGVAAGALAVTKLGAQTAMPSTAEVEAMMSG